jgi:hypothetical protein
MQQVNMATKALFEIDTYLDQLVQKIELLSYINPINIEEEKKKFFASNYMIDPVFSYPTMDFDKFKLHREMFTLPIEQIEDKILKQLYEDIIYFYSGLIQCIETVNEGKKFYYNSLHSFGTPTEQDVENAKFILSFDDDEEFSIKAQVVSQKELHTYISMHSFPTIDSLKNSETSLSTLHLYESDNKRILAKFRKLDTDSVKVLTYTPLKKRHPYSLIFTLNNGETFKTNTKIEYSQHTIINSYGVKFDKSNDDLGESLLETQSDLIFK